MPKPRMTIQQLQDSGKWLHLSRLERAERLLDELNVGTPGRPAVPPDLDDATKLSFEQVCDALESEHRLWLTDAGPVLDYIAAYNAGDVEKADDLNRDFRSREPMRPPRPRPLPPLIMRPLPPGGNQ